MRSRSEVGAAPAGKPVQEVREGVVATLAAGKVADLDWLCFGRSKWRTFAGVWSWRAFRCLCEEE